MSHFLADFISSLQWGMLGYIICGQWRVCCLWLMARKANPTSELWTLYLFVHKRYIKEVQAPSNMGVSDKPISIFTEEIYSKYR